MAQVASEAGAKDPPAEASDADSLDASSLTVAQLQEELTKRGLDTKWNPLKGKKELVERLQASFRAQPVQSDLAAVNDLDNARKLIEHANLPSGFLEAWCAPAGVAEQRHKSPQRSPEGVRCCPGGQGGS